MKTYNGMEHVVVTSFSFLLLFWKINDLNLFLAIIRTFTMDRQRNSKYDRVMSRLCNRSRSNVKPNSYVTRHEIPSSVTLGAKPSGSNIVSSIFSELPVVLNDYTPEVPVKKTYVVKPRRTIKSLNPAISPHRTPSKACLGLIKEQANSKVCAIRSGGSAPVVSSRSKDRWPDSHLRQCLSSRSHPHTKLKELKNEIKAYHETERNMKLRSRLYESMGVVLDDVGTVAFDKSVQVQPQEIDGDTEIRSERSSGENARAAVPDKQMSPAPPRYPVDRYLVESSKKIEMVNIIDDDIWNPEPALRPEDEILLRKLHNMLQSTADDLKLLSGELTRHHEPQVRVKSQPAPLDQEFNEKVHIEEVVNAKFHGHKIIDFPISPKSKLNNFINKSLGSKLNKTKAVNAGVQVNPVPVFKKTTNKNLQISKTKVVHIKEDKANSKETKLNNGEIQKDTAKIHYNEISYKYEEPNVVTLKKRLQVQKMPEVNIRSELKEQKVLQLDIMPNSKDELINSTSNINVGIIAIQHETPVVPLRSLSKPKSQSQYPKVSFQSNKQPVRKISKMSTGDSSESNNNVSSDAQQTIDMHKAYKLVSESFPKSSVRVESKNKKAQYKKNQQKRPNSSLDEWNKKLNAVYGQPSSSRVRVLNETDKSHCFKKSNFFSRPKPNSKPLNNAEYIPYTHLTLGGVRVSEIEKEISDIPNKNDIPLSPILDKILSSRENSFHKDSPRARIRNQSPKLLTTSDENLLQEVLDIEKTVTKSLTKNMKSTSNTKSDKNTVEDDINDSGKDNSYADDFEDEKSEHSAASEQIEGKKSPTGSVQSIEDDETTVYNTENEIGCDEENNDPNASEPNLQNTTYTKTLNLSFKNSVDVFEFIHAIDTQETGTQSNSISKISLKETQTSPRNERANIQPIHNDLWPSIDPKGEIENLFQLEKDFIKKLILDEYGDILEKNITKPSTSKDQENRRNNVAASQKNTQTSPAHVRSVMTSPTRTKTRTTSPLSTFKIDRQTSPMAQVMQEEEFKIEIENEIDDLGASINLSSPRFSLRLPRDSREVLSNFSDQSRSHSKTGQKNISQGLNNLRKNTVSSSSSVDADNSSDISSLGEVKIKLRRRLKKSRISALSESSSSSMLSRYSAGLVSGEILPLKSEVEVSLGQVVKKSNRQKHNESDGEMDL